MKKNNKEKNLALAGLFIAIGIILPFFTGQIKEIGDSLLPMHIPVLLCGFICGYKYGLMVGLLIPFLRSLIIGMPPMYPNALYMALELATYGFAAGFMYLKINKKSIFSIYLCLISSMILGRIVWGISKTILYGLKGDLFTFNAFITGGIIDAIPGILIQLILIPLIILGYERLHNKDVARNE